MLNWIEVLRLAKNGNLTPDRRVEKTDTEWRQQLTPEQFRVTRQKGTERAFTGQYCALFEPGRYACICCGTVLFDSEEKFESGTGWPSFTQPIKDNVIKYEADNSHGMQRVETLCNVCDAHLGHVFPDGPKPSGLRYCMNSVALSKVELDGEDESSHRSDELELATFGGGCFWCTEAIFQSFAGVKHVVSGYSGGKVKNPTYKEVCSGLTGHAEVVQIVFDPNVISYDDLVRIHLYTHDPTTLNRQGADVGTQYRSAIFYHNDPQKVIASNIIAEVQADYKDTIVTEVSPLDVFYQAEAYHQDYYKQNAAQPYCQVVISPKLAKLRQKYADRLQDGVEA